MKKEEQTWVDDHFRRHEADISVTFDPKHWEQLAAALDQATRPEGLLPPPSPAGRKPSGKIKGWWVSGMWALLLLSSAWVLWQRTQVAAPVVPAINSTPENPPPAGSTAPAPPAFVTPAPPVSGAAEETGTMLPKQQELEFTRDHFDENSAQPTPDPNSEPLPTADTLQRHLPTPGITPVDTTSTGKKKKKHLFW